MKEIVVFVGVLNSDVKLVAVCVTVLKANSNGRCSAEQRTKFDGGSRTFLL